MHNFRKLIFEAINKGILMGIELDDETPEAPIFKQTGEFKPLSKADMKKEVDAAIESGNITTITVFYMQSIGYTYTAKNSKDLKRVVDKFVQKNPSVNLNWIDTSRVTDMRNLFSETDFCGDVSYWDVSKVTKMGAMFKNCKNFNNNLSKWDTSSLINATHMFIGCHEFTGKGLENWDTSHVIDMSFMFEECYKFNGDVSNWDVSNVENMRAMFNKCNSFNRSLSNWNMKSVMDVFSFMSVDSKHESNLKKVANSLDMQLNIISNYRDRIDAMFYLDWEIYTPDWVQKYHEQQANLKDTNKQLAGPKNENIIKYINDNFPLITSHYNVSNNKQNNVKIELPDVTVVSIVLQDRGTYRVYVNSVYRTIEKNGVTYVRKEILSPEVGLLHRQTPYRSVEGLDTYQECIDWLMNLPVFNMQWTKYDRI